MTDLLQRKSKRPFYVKMQKRLLADYFCKSLYYFNLSCQFFTKTPHVFPRNSLQSQRSQGKPPSARVCGRSGRRDEICIPRLRCRCDKIGWNNKGSYRNNLLRAFFASWHKKVFYFFFNPARIRLRDCGVKMCIRDRIWIADEAEGNSLQFWILHEP